MIVNKAKKIQGFTLFESLLVVGIMSILFSIAIPLVSELRTNLLMQKLDDTAREIFVLSQNELTSDKANGTLSSLQTTMESSYSSHSLKTLKAKPSDYITDDDNWQNLYYLKKGDAALDNFILNQSGATAGVLNGGNYIVEFNPETAVVYGVFYADKTFTYDDVKSLLSRNRNYRKSKMIGYYGGVNLSISDSMLPKQFSPKVEVVNKEDLYLKVTCDGLRYISQTQNYLTMKVTVTDESYVEGSDAHKWVYELSGGDPNFFVSASGEVESDILLDSLRQGEDFKTITNSKLTPGDNLKVTVEFNYSKNKTSIAGSANAETNSLFASKTADSSGILTINVSNTRQLYNLRDTVYPANSDFNVIQTKAIDFDSSNWDDDSTVEFENGKPINGLSNNGFAGIENDFMRSYSASGNEIENFSFVGASNKSYAGLFADVENCKLSNIKLVDCKASGSSFVGMLAGRTEDTQISGCSSYLSLQDSDGRTHSDMDTRVENLKVSASGSYAGGLVGYAASNTNISDSFGAVNVSANSNAGGLMGYATGGEVKNCYSSGKVSASSFAGGITAYSYSTDFTDCYSTSDVTAETYGGGFAAEFIASDVSNCRTFGAVSKSDGNIDTTYSGPFCGILSSSSTLKNCSYLKQGKYNANYKSTAEYGTATGYENMKSKNDNSSALAHPYSHELLDTAFPFDMLKNSDGTVIEHYGDWPTELTLQTSLVYYERYSDGSYGFYAKTSLNDKMEESSSDTKDWTVNTLKDQYCVEDGYALMTIYKLSDIYYSLNKPDTQNETSLSNSKRYDEHLTIADSVEDAQDSKACLITDRQSLTFRKDNLSFTIPNARVYQLPYDLQMTKRYKATRFYDRLDLTGMVGDYKAVDNYVFYYCPDFAKNAINPDPESLSNSPNYPSDPSGEDEPIIVRSPRQLNALGYAPYYWNPSNGSQSFYFKQETDLIYSKYARDSSGKTSYCGKTYDLMDTSVTNKYRNRPIGQPKNQVFATPDGYATNMSGNFRQTYDGTGHKIVDYCLKTYTTQVSGTNSTDSYQFTGLFGEAESAVLKNIIMTASTVNENNSNAKSSGYIISTCDDGSHHMGVGAIAGLSYVEIGGQYNGKETTIENCVVSGYDVGYQGSASTFSVGGLTGYNFGTIKNSSAVLRTLIFTDKNGNTSSSNKFVGGISGSLNGSGTISESYCGASAVADNNSKSHFGLIVGASDDIYGYGSSDSDSNNYRKRSNVIQCCYSFGKWTGVYSSGYSTPTVYNCVQNSGFYSLTTKQCFYVTDDIDSNSIYLRSKSIWGSDSTVRAFTASQLSSAVKSSASLSRYWSSDVLLKKFASASADNTFPWNSSDSGAYQFPAFVYKVGENGEWDENTYVHYGCLSY